jgi:hypothetical protein
MLGYGIHRLPDRSQLFRLPRTPIDNSRIHESAAEYRLLLEAGRIVPGDASVLIRSDSGSLERDTFLHWFAVALLPGRQVQPRVVEGRPIPAELEAEVDYLVVLGRGAGVADAQLLLATEDGTVWRRNRP